MSFSENSPEYISEWNFYVSEFQQNRTISKNYFFEEGRGNVGGRGPPILNSGIIYYW